MDPLTLILTIAGCIAGLFVLYVVVGLAVAAIVAKRAGKAAEAFTRRIDDDDFFKRARR